MIVAHLRVHRADKLEVSLIAALKCHRSGVMRRLAIVFCDETFQQVSSRGYADDENILQLATGSFAASEGDLQTFTYGLLGLAPTVMFLGRLRADR